MFYTGILPKAPAAGPNSRYVDIELAFNQRISILLETRLNFCFKAADTSIINFEF